MVRHLLIGIGIVCSEIACGRPPPLPQCPLGARVVARQTDISDCGGKATGSYAVYGVSGGLSGRCFRKQDTAYECRLDDAGADKAKTCVEQVGKALVFTPTRLECAPLNAAHPNEKPLVVLAGSTTEYRPEENAESVVKTSMEKLDELLRDDVKLEIVPVSYATNLRTKLNQWAAPAVVAIHASAFHDDSFDIKAGDSNEEKERKTADASRAVRKFQQTIGSLFESLPKTRFLVYSRVPPKDPDSHVCDRWRSQVQFLLDSKFAPRLVFYPVERADSDFKGPSASEISTVILCQAGLYPDDYCSKYIRGLEQSAMERIKHTTCT